MQILVVLAHPDKNSFNHAIAQTVIDELQLQNCTVVFHDLYAENFPALLPAVEIPQATDLPEIIEQHCSELENADGIIIIHPNWWGMPPAIMKGWIDRIFRPKRAYEFIGDDSGEGVPNGLLNAQAALVLNTSNTKTQRELQIFKDPLETLWKICIFDLCGVKKFRRRMFNIIVTSTTEQRAQWLLDSRMLVQEFLETLS